MERIRLLMWGSMGSDFREVGVNFLGFRVSLLGRALHYHDPLLARVGSSVESLTVGLWGSFSR